LFPRALWGERCACCEACPCLGLAGKADGGGPCEGLFWQFTHLQTPGTHFCPWRKHSQYFLRHPDFLHLQPAAFLLAVENARGLRSRMERRELRRRGCWGWEEGGA